MKTLKKGDEFKRVKDGEVDALLANNWAFVKKSLWKEKVRDLGKKKVSAPKAEKKVEVKSKSQYVKV